MVNLVHVFADGYSEFNSSFHRGCIFVDALNRAGHTASLIHVEDWMRDRRKNTIAQADIIVVERLLVEEAKDRAKYWHDSGKPIVIDIDDAYSLLEKSEVSGNQAARFWSDGMVDIHYGSVTYAKKLSISPLEQFRQGLKHVTGLTSPSRILNEDWAMYAPTWVIPNYIDAAKYIPFRKKYTGVPKELIIGWGGSMSHKLSFERSGVAEALRKIIQKYSHVKFLLAGDNRIIDILKLPPERIIYQPYVPYYEWPRVAARMDIIVAPLQGRYDHSRSALKQNEASALQIPSVVTGCPTYEVHEAMGLGLYVQDSLAYDSDAIEARAKVWVQHLSDTIENYDVYKKKAIADSEKAEYFWIDNRIGDVINTYEDIIANG